MAVAVRSADGRLSRPDNLETIWRDRIRQAREHRKRHEPTWLSNLAFAAGKHWLVWDERQRQMRHLADVDQRYAGRELYTADKINEHVQAQLGELTSDDDRPELLLAQEGDTAEDVQHALNDLVAHGWEFEWNAAQSLTQARRLCLKLGVSAIRVRFDPSRGPLAAHVPVGPDGQARLDPESLQHLEQHGQLPDGSLPKFKPVYEGKTCWEPLSAFNLLTPPGVNHEDAFPWEIVVRPAPLDQVKDIYGAAAAGLVEDGDIASIIGVTTGQQTLNVSERSKGRLREHVWLYTCYQRPNVKNPQGQVAILASNQMSLLHVDDKLPLQACDGDYRSGIHYLHWWRLDDGFWSRAFIEPLKDPQRLINRRETQNAEIIDRGMPKAFVKEGSLVHNPAGLPLEVVELKQDAVEPNFFQGMGPGPWMYEDLAHHADNMAHASTLSELRLGENPQNVNTYAQLALLNENESAKRSTILVEHKRAIADCVEDSVCLIRRYWPEQKQILVTGDDNRIAQKVFEKSQIPDMYVIRPAAGAARPRSQGAELTKIDAIWQAAVTTGVVAGPNGAAWVEWYAKSLDAGQAMDMPSEESNPQLELANFENFLMVDQGELPEPADHDLQPVHIPIHREALDQARAAGDLETASRVQAHIDASIQKTATARKAWRFQDPTDTNDMASDLALDEDQALRENQMMAAGQPLNPEALQQALEQIRQGLNPETGEPLDAQAAASGELRDLLNRAALKPTLVENLEVHMDRHAKVIKSALFDGFAPDVRERFLTHFDLTRTLWLSIPTMPDKVDSPKVTLSLRESVGPSTIAKVLHRAGVPEGDPGELATEPPLENMVQADVVEPNPQKPAPAPASPKEK